MQRRRKPNPLKDNDDEADAAHVALSLEAADDEEAPLQALPSCVAYPTASEVLVGEAAAAAPVPLIGVTRLLGRQFASLGGAKFLAAESDEFVGAEIVPEPDDDGHGAKKKKG